MKKVFLIFIFLFTLFLVPFLVSVPLYGQGYQMFRKEMEQIARQTKWKIGPFRIYPTIRLRDIGYDDNVYYMRQEDEPISDFTGTISPEVKIYLLFRNYLILSFTENPEYIYYFKQKRERRWNNTLSPAFRLLLLSRFVISGRYSHWNRRRRASSEFDVRANERLKVFSGSLFYETPRGTSFGFSGSIRKISYEDITLPGEKIYLSRALNREERSGYFEFYYRIFSESFIFLRGEYVEYNFENIESRWRNSYSYQVYSGIRFPLLGRLRGTFSLGYKMLIPERRAKKAFSGLVGNTNITLRIRRFNFRFEYIRDCSFSYWTDNIFFLEDRYGIGISFYLTKFLRLDYNFTYGESTYPELITLRTPDESYKEIKREDIYRSQIVGFVFRIIRNVGIGVRVNFWERDSNIYWVARDRVFVGGYVTYEF